MTRNVHLWIYTFLLEAQHTGSQLIRRLLGEQEGREKGFAIEPEPCWWEIAINGLLAPLM